MAQDQTWTLEHDLSTQEVVSLDNDNILLIGFWGAAILDDNGQILETIEYPSYWIADCTSNFYHEGLIKHVDVIFSHVFESIDLKGNIVTTQDLDPSLTNECLHYEKIYQADENTLIFRNIFDDLSHELLLDKMEFTSTTGVSVSIFDEHYINLYSDDNFFFVQPTSSIEGEGFIWEWFLESPDFWFSTANQINFIIAENSNQNGDSIKTFTYDLNESNRLDIKTIQRSYSPSLTRERSETIAQIHGEVNGNCQYSAFIFDDFIQLMVGDPSKPLSSVFLDHDLRLNARNFTERIKTFSDTNGDLFISVGNKLYGFTDVCDQNVSNEQQTDNEQSGGEETMDDSEETTPQLFQERFPWITSDLIAINCSELEILEYDFGGYSFVYFSDGRLFYQDGTLYCETSESLDCVSAYELTPDKISNEWRCEESSSDNSEEENESENEEESNSNTNDGTQEYPWLTSIDLSGTCLIEEYDLGPFAYLYVDKDDSGTLYFDDGTFYCESMGTRDCRALYDLTQDQLTNSWSCDSTAEDEEENNQDEGLENDEDLFSDYEWLSSIISSECSEGSITEYASGPFFFLLIQTEESSDLYFQDGTYYCPLTETYDCLAAYGLTDPQRTFTCNSNFNKVDNRNFQTDQLTISIFPNPTRSLLNVSIPSNQTSIDIFSASGKVMLSYKGLDKGIFFVDLSHFDEGIYFVRFVNGENSITKKVVKI